MKKILAVVAALITQILMAGNAFAGNDVPSVSGTEEIYKTVDGTELKLHIFNPPHLQPSDKRAAIVFFFGGGWTGGSPSQFFPHCEYLSSRGMVAMSAEYRVNSRNNTSPKECVMDGKSAVRWIRQHAASLGIDPDKVAAGGGSAGGHVAAATGTTAAFNQAGEDLRVSCIPNALVLFNPVFDNGPDGYGHSRVKDYWRDISPLHNINSNTPPTVVFLGTKDKLIPVATAETYQSLMEDLGLRCDLHLYKDQPHGFFNFKNAENYSQTVAEMDQFLTSLGFLEDKRSVVPHPVDLAQIEGPRVLAKAERYLREHPRTVTADSCERSEGGKHDFYSEGDYWWPDPMAPDGPYIRRDGETNPANFLAHRKAMIRLSDIIGTLTSAYLLTGEEHYAAHAVTHLKAWFVSDATRMNPSLLYGQAIKGLHSGRSIGIIDTIHLVEVARGTKLLCDSPSFPMEDQIETRKWFREYLTWIDSHPYGEIEKQHPNNHGVCWSLQAAAFADLVNDTETLVWIRHQFKTVYLEKMMALDGSFPAELERTKPYGYSLFVIDAMAGVAQLASTPEDDLWTFQLPDGRGMKKGMEFIVPYIKDKSRWPKEPDVMYWDEWPVRHPSLLFAGVKFNKPDYLETWEKLEPDPATFEVLRNLPLRYPLLWIDD